MSVNLIKIPNAFQPEINQKQILEFIPGARLDQYIKDLPLYDQDIKIIIAVNGKIIPEPYHIEIVDGDIISACAKTEFTAAAAVASYVGTAVAGTAFYAVTFLATSFLIGYGMNLLMSALAPDTPENPNQRTAYTFGDDRQSYFEGTQIPYLFGINKVYGQVITSYVDTSANNDDTINIIMGICDHEIESITDLRLNNKPVEKYKDVETFTRLGAQTDEVIPGFDRAIFQNSNGGKLEGGNPGEPVYQDTSGTSVTHLKFIIRAPKGLYIRSKKDGAVHGISITFRVSWRIMMTTTWSYQDKTITTGDSDIDPKAFTVEITDLTPGQYETKAEFLYAGGHVLPNPESVYDLYFSSLQEITAAGKFIYPGIAKYAVKALATDQLSGGKPTPSCLASRMWLSIWDESGTPGWINKRATNPAWIVWHLLQNYAGISIDRLIWADFKNWADYCDEDVTEGLGVFEERLAFAMILSNGNFWDEIQRVARLGRASVIRRGYKYGIFVDKYEGINPVVSHLFTMANIVKETFSIQYLPTKDRANAIEIEYTDYERDYTRQVVTVFSPDYLSSDSGQQASRVSLQASMTQKMATREGIFRMNSNLFLNRAVSFDAFVDSFACVVGDLFYFQHEVMDYGTDYSGRIVSATTNTVTLDRTVTIHPDKVYKILIRKLDGTFEEKTVTNIPGIFSILTLSTTFSSIPVQYDVYTFGVETTYKKIYRLTSVSRSNDLTRNIVGLEYVPEIYSNNDDLVIQEIPNPEWFVQSQSAIQVKLAEDIFYYPDGSYIISVSVSWISEYPEISNIWEIWMEDITTPGRGVLKKITEIARNYAVLTESFVVGQTYRFTVISSGGGAIDSGDNQAEITITGKSYAPNAPYDLIGTGVLMNILLRWVHYAEPDLDHFMVYRSETNDTETADYIGSTQIDISSLIGTYTDTPSTAGTYYYWIKAVDTTGNISAFSVGAEGICIGIDGISDSVSISSDQFFQYPAGSTTPVTTPIVLTATLSGSLTTYDWEYWTGSAWTPLSVPQDAQTYSLAHDNIAWGSARALEIRCSSGTSSDYTNIFKIFDGSHAITPIVTNASHTVPSDSDGNVTSYDESGTGIQIYEGSTALTFSTALGPNLAPLNCCTDPDNDLSTTTGWIEQYGYKSYEIGGKTGYCLRITANGINSNPIAFKNNISVTPGETYRYSGYVKAGTEYTYKPIIYNNSGGIYLLNNPYESTADWSFWSHDITIPPGCLLVTIYVGQVCLATATTYIEFDDISFRNVVPPTLSNSSFICNTPVVVPTGKLTVGAITGNGTTTCTVGVHSLMDAATPLVTISYPITVKRADGVEFSFNQVQTITKSKAGEAGETGSSARTVVLTTTAQAFTYTTAGTTPSPATATVTATALNTTGSVWYEFFKNDVSVQGPTENDNTYPYTPTAAFASMPEKIEVQIREISGTGPILSRDQMSMVGLQAGAHGITAAMSNSAHTVPASFAGAVSSYLLSGTTIQIWEGSRLLTYHSLASSGQYWIDTPIVTPTSAITVGSISGTTTCTVTDHSAMSSVVDVVTITYPISVIREDGTTVTIELVQTITKSKMGDAGENGINSTTSSLTNDSMVVTTLVDGTGGTYSGINCQSTMEIYEGRTLATGWSFSKSDGTGVTSTINASSGLCTITALSTDTGYVDITATKLNYSNQVCRITIAKSKTGAVGDDLINRWVTSSIGAIGKNTSNIYNPTTITFSAFTQTGTGYPSLYAGWFVIKEYNGSTWSAAKYTSSGNESSKEYAPSASTGITAIQCTLYAAGGTVTQLDQEAIPVVLDGVDANGAEALTILDSWSVDENFSPIEKAWFNSGWLIRSEEFLNLKTQATTLGLTTQATTFMNAFGAWGTYLNAGVAWTPPTELSQVIDANLPSWIKQINLGTSTSIVRATFISTATTYFNALTVIKTAIDSNINYDISHALTTLDDWASDGVLSPVEKFNLRAGWIIRSSEFIDLKAIAVSLGLTTQATTFMDAFDVWGTYLNAGAAWTPPTTTPITDAMIPSWIKDVNLETSTVVVRATFNSICANYFAALVVIKTAISDKINSNNATAGTTALWSGVSGTGTPAPYATANQSDAITNNAINVAAGTAVWTSVTNRPTSLATLDSTSATRLGTMADYADVTTTAKVNTVLTANTLAFSSGSITFGAASHQLYGDANQIVLRSTVGYDAIQISDSTGISIVSPAKSVTVDVDDNINLDCGTYSSDSLGVIDFKSNGTRFMFAKAVGLFPGGSNSTKYLGYAGLFHWKALYISEIWNDGTQIIFDTVDDLYELSLFKPRKQMVIDSDTEMKTEGAVYTDPVHGHEYLDLYSLPKYLTNYDQIFADIKKHTCGLMTDIEIEEDLNDYEELGWMLSRNLCAFTDLTNGAVRQLDVEMKELFELAMGRITELEKQIKQMKEAS